MKCIMKFISFQFCFVSADKKLFTPGPLLVSRATKEAMLRDLGSRDTEFIEAVKFIRHELINIAGKINERTELRRDLIFRLIR